MGDWIKHEGGPCPVPSGTEVVVRFRSGVETTIDSPESMDWERSGFRHDIIAYRVTMPAVSPTTAPVLPIVLLHANAKVPTRANPNDAGLDLYALEDCMLKAGHVKAVRTGISVAIEPGYAGFIWPRSGLAVCHGVDRLAGVIDAGYRGEVCAALTCLDGTRFLKAGDRVAQIIVQKVELLNVMVVDKLPDSVRGENGFGSSGVA